MLLALGRVVATKVVLRPEGAGDAGDVPMTSWQRNLLQTGMHGSAIVFANGKLPVGVPMVPPPRTEVPERIVVIATGTSTSDLRNALREQIDTKAFQGQYEIL